MARWGSTSRSTERLSIFEVATNSVVFAVATDYECLAVCSGTRSSSFFSSRAFFLISIIVFIAKLYTLFADNQKFIDVDVQTMLRKRLADTLGREAAKWKSKANSEEINFSIDQMDYSNQHYDAADMHIEINEEIRVDDNENVVIVTPRKRRKP